MKNFFLTTIVFLSTLVYISNTQQWEYIQGLSYELNIDPTNENALIIHTNVKIYLSFNSGDSWDEIQFPNVDNPFRVWVLNSNILIYFQNSNDEFYFSKDTGKTYRKVTLFWKDYLSGGRERPCGEINCCSFSDGKYFIGANKGAYMSNDDWETWNHITDTLTRLNYMPPSVFSMVVQDSNLYIGGFRYGVYKTTNNGKNWVKRIGSLADNWIECEYLYLFQNMLIGFFIDRYGSEFLAYSSDKGNSWNILNTPIEIKENPNIIGCKDRLFMTQNWEIFHTNDTGKSWGKFYKDSILFAMQLGPFNLNSKYFFISRIGIPNVGIPGGTFRAKWENCYFDDETDIEYDLINLVNVLLCYPNPATVYIEVTLSNHTLMGVVEKVRVYDVLGVCVITSPPARLHSGEGSKVRLDVSHLSPGVYFVKVGGRVQRFVKI